MDSNSLLQDLLQDLLEELANTTCEQRKKNLVKLIDLTKKDQEVKLRFKEYRAKYKEKRNEYYREYRKKNPEKIAEYNKTYATKNKEKITEYHQKRWKNKSSDLETTKENN